MNVSSYKMHYVLASFMLVCFYIIAFQAKDDAAKTSRLLKTTSHNGFEIVEKEDLKEYDAEGVTYEHTKTGAELYIVNWSGGDSKSEKVFDTCREKAFGIFFRTPPNDSTGVPHIIEHSLLCGSRKYKTKEPFTNLLQGSLNTFLNAFTFPDRTGYGFASCNTKDFLNSMNVYLDAVFFPRAAEDPFVLAQEGWHLEPANKKKVNETAELSDNGSESRINMKYQGVVYNEMKGVYSSVDEVMGQLAQTAMFPDNTYHFDSGGNPADIPKLTFPKFVEFYKKYYHPTNAKIFIAVPDDSNNEEILSLIDSYLNEFEKDETKKAESVIEWQKKIFVEPKFETHHYQSKTDEHYVLVSWLLNDKPLSQDELFALNILNFLLLDAPNSKLQKSLLTSGLGKVVISDGLDDSLIQNTFSVGLKGVTKDNVEKVEEFILNELIKISRQGFSDIEIESALNSFEIKLRELNADNSKGISFMFSTMAKWIYDGKPSSGTKFEDGLNKLKTILSEERSSILQVLLNSLLVKNNHRVVIHMSPQFEFEKNQEKSEQKRIHDLMSKMSDEQLNYLIEFSEELKERQTAEDSEEALATIPSISVSDIESRQVEYPISVEKNAFDSGITLVSHQLPYTSGILYADLAVDISMVPFSMALKYLSLFESLLTKTGTKDLSFEELSEEILTHTGGISVDTLISPVKNNSFPDNIIIGDDHVVTKLMIQGKSLESPQKINKLLSIMTSILTNANLDNQSEAVNILESHCSSIKSSIQSSGTEYAYIRVGARQSALGFISERMNGVTSLNECRELLEESKSDWSSVLMNLDMLRSLILKESTVRSGMVVNLTGSQKALDEVKDVLKEKLNALPGRKNGKQLPNYFTTVHPWVVEARQQLNLNAPFTNEALIVPTKVNYVVSGKKIFDVGEPVSGSFFVALNKMSTDYLWNNVRVLGGAYGSSVELRSTDGFFAFTSYRDPNIKETLEFYDGAASNMLEEANKLKINPKGLEKYIISSIGSFDGSSLSSDDIGSISFNDWLTGVNSTTKEITRQEILNTKPEDLEKFAKKIMSNKTDFSVVVVTSKSSYEEAIENGIELKLVNVIEDFEMEKKI